MEFARRERVGQAADFFDQGCLVGSCNRTLHFGAKNVARKKTEKDTTDNE